ncbi:acyl-CoA dehydrogenase [Acrocarpospora pleiomorpha]|uniref:Acyl-CoA dehydrogenase n=1 Tax=Acrocarpospora pleiomorpha TaxID=90975 RepID=A0A5M3XTL0_9ACTN|nr:acyl-CoA dehydrogenase family protein [Acrocarpospora pleiomorpha]GES24624.1 acyl-CoA dehydrogenase [Acrocarpospora pleiomorpha]
MSAMAAELYSDEQREFATEVRRFLAANQPINRVRQLAGDPIGRDGELWRRAAKEADLLGLMIPEEYGGSGFGFAEASLVLTAAGAALTSWPYLSSAVLSSHCLVAAADTDAKSRWLPALAGGEVVATLAVADDQGDWALANGSVRAEEGPGGAWTLTGHKSFVTDGPAADILLTFGTTGSETALFVVRTDASGVSSTSLPALDSTRKLGRFVFEGAAAERVGDVADLAGLDASLCALAAAALVCEQAGGIATVLDMTSRYAKDRRQFGRSIGSFQAIKHKCVDIYIRSEATAAFAESVALSFDAAVRAGRLGEKALRSQVATAAVYCGEAFVKSAHDMIQVHGGIGFTWEHDAHLFLRRAAADAKLFGGKSRNMAVLTAALRSGALLMRPTGGEDAR